MSRSKILIVDDDPLGRDVALALLEQEGYDLSVATTGSEAIERVVSTRPDVILLDVVMPGIDGHEVCRRLRADSCGASIPIVLVTALDSKDDLVRGLEAGADDFLSKPVNGMELRARVRSMLRIKRQHDDLQAQHSELRRLQQQKQELMAMIVHDLKSPLAAMILIAEAVAGRAEVGARSQTSLREVGDLGRSIDRMILDLLDVSRSDDGALKPRKKRVEMKQIAASVCGMLQLRADAKEISFSVDVGDTVADADPNLLRRILENLVDNAIKYAPQKSGIRIAARSAEGGVEIRIADEGPGVPLEERERIFERFVRLERDAEQHARMSVGLGLAFCRVAAQAHGGRIWVEDGKPNGSSFCVALPGSPPSRAQG